MTTHAETPLSSERSKMLWAILAMLALYGTSFAVGLPQGWTVAALGGHHAEEPAVDGTADAHKGANDVEHAADAHHAGSPPPLWTVAPFVLLLGAIATFPLIHATEHWWEHNRNRFIVAAGLGALTLAYYAFLHHEPVEAHWPGHAIVAAHDGSVFQTEFVATIFGNALLQEYIPFIVLLFSLYTIAGGIRITGDLEATPTTNATVMLIGGLLASLIGTTGAAMLLVRPLLETNHQRKHVAHTVVFFIFIVCNCGGCLLPIGDPPLFLGYLQGVDFFWTLNLWPEWLFVNGMLLAVYWSMDQFYHHPRETVRDIERDVTRLHRLRVSGLKVNGLLLVGVVIAVAMLDPSKAFPGTDWHPWLYFREAVQLALVAMSLAIGPRESRLANRFTYDAIVEVAALFVGIFVCMQPALQILKANGTHLVERFDMGPGKFFWATGTLSSFLDNAPTYLVFFQTAQDPELAGGPTAGVPEPLLAAISLGAVMMGAMTYIGNGPNFMVKAIAEKSGVKMPSFFGYMGYSVLILLPILGLMDWIFILRP
ncbi:sodium:proton antiporter [Lacipirellula parvula]|uniref:Na+/H+ antiporter n=1 Tax=Lacipirellula parvula TaxID=2650471 RepID=A0A5K7XP97_9BACT|nr:sodium:proton antiporter [Lacipirellula parvula]BBO35129.1 na+/H+ antiporter [Lacipirellula parvula]